MSDRILLLLFSVWAAAFIFHTIDRIQFERMSWSDSKVWEDIKEIEFRTRGGGFVKASDKVLMEAMIEAFLVESSRTDRALIEKVGYLTIIIRASRLRVSSREFHLFEAPWGLRGIDDYHLDTYNDFFFKDDVPYDLEVKFFELRELIIAEHDRS